MNNLKRVLSLVMSGAMLVGMLTIGASAANTAFSDKDEITHTEAVNTMAALGVIKGRDNGQYDPAGNVSRAEMAKIICVMLNGGEDPAWGSGVQTTFTDTQNHWARNYIAYCANKGIIAGMGDGTFKPDGLVTGAQAAKMMLVALDYDPDIFKLVGLKWEDNTNDIATSKGLYKDIKGLNTSAPLTRDDAAQMAFNCLEAKPMVKSFESVAANGEITYKYNEGSQTFLNKYFEAEAEVGPFLGNADVLDIKDGEIQVEIPTYDKNGDVNGTTTVNIPFELDIGFIGEEVKVIYKDDSKPAGLSNKDTIYGVFPTGNTEVLNVKIDDVSDPKTDTKLKVDGTKYSVANLVTVCHNYVGSGKTVGTVDSDGKVTKAADAAAVWAEIKSDNNCDAVKFVLNSDGDISKVYVVNYNVGKVTSVTSSKVVVSGAGSIDVEKNDVAEGLKVNDVVTWNAIYAAKSDKDKAFFTVEKAETVEGKLKSFKTDKGAVTTLSIDGTSYDTVGGALDDTLGLDDQVNELDKKIGDELTVYLVNGFAYAVTTDGEVANDYALVIGSNGVDTSDEDMSEGKVKLLLGDNTEVTYVVHKKSDVQPETNADTLKKGALIKYGISDGQIKIEKVVTTKANTTNVWNSDTKLVAGKNVAASNCVLYTTTKSDGTGDYKAYKIRDLGDYTITAADVFYVTDSSDRVIFAAVDGKATVSGVTSDTVYGMVTKYVGISEASDGEEYKEFQVWNGTDTVTMYVPTSKTDVEEGKFVTFTSKSNDIYDGSGDYTVYGDAAATTDGTAKSDHSLDVAVKNYDAGDKTLAYYYVLAATKDGTYASVKDGDGKETSPAITRALDKDAVIVYVDRDGKKGIEDQGAVPSFDTSTGYANAKVIFDDKDETIVAIFVNVNEDTTINGEKSVKDKDGNVTTDKALIAAAGGAGA